jgi:hypothetical protein
MDSLHSGFQDLISLLICSFSDKYLKNYVDISGKDFDFLPGIFLYFFNILCQFCTIVDDKSI